MRDVTISELAEKVRQEFGLEIPKPVMRKLAQHLFKKIFKVMKSDQHRVSLRESDIMTVYKDIDVSRICGDLAEGKDVPTYHTFNEKYKLKKIHKKYIKTPAFHLLPAHLSANSTPQPEPV